MKARVGKRVAGLEAVLLRHDLRSFRSLDFSALSDDELDHLEWIAEQRGIHGPEWIESTLSPDELTRLDGMLRKVVVLPE